MTYRTATITSKGQLTLPKPVADAAGIHPYSKVVVGDDSGQVTIRPATATALARLPYRGKPKEDDAAT